MQFAHQRVTIARQQDSKKPFALAGRGLLMKLIEGRPGQFKLRCTKQEFAARFRISNGQPHGLNQPLLAPEFFPDFLEVRTAVKVPLARWRGVDALAMQEPAQFEQIRIDGMIKAARRLDLAGKRAPVKMPQRRCAVPLADRHLAMRHNVSAKGGDRGNGCCCDAGNHDGTLTPGGRLSIERHRTCLKDGVIFRCRIGPYRAPAAPAVNHGFRDGFYGCIAARL